MTSIGDHSRRLMRHRFSVEGYPKSSVDGLLSNHDDGYRAKAYWSGRRSDGVATYRKFDVDPALLICLDLAMDHATVRFSSHDQNSMRDRVPPHLSRRGGADGRRTCDDRDDQLTRRRNIERLARASVVTAGSKQRQERDEHHGEPSHCRLGRSTPPNSSGPPRNASAPGACNDHATRRRRLTGGASRNLGPIDPPIHPAGSLFLAAIVGLVLA
jgi:hypothetical protein